KPIGAGAPDPNLAVEAGREYDFVVRVGPPEEGFVSGSESFPEPPLKPEEASLTLSVLLYERYTCPDGTLQTIQLPRAGASPAATFRIAISAASRVFDGRITIFHNNRPLIESSYRIAVQGATGDGTPPARAELRTLMRTRAFDTSL